MTSYKHAVVLLDDLEEYADNHEFSEALMLIAKARKALDEDFGSEFPQIYRPKKPSSARQVQ